MRSVDWVAGLVKVDPWTGHSKGSAKAAWVGRRRLAGHATPRSQ